MKCSFLKIQIDNICLRAEPACFGQNFKMKKSASSVYRQIVHIL